MASKAMPNQNGAAGGRLTAADAARRAKAHLEELTGGPCETVSGLARTETGWSVSLEVLELERIPRTTDVLASYVVELDGRGELAGYHRAGRYCRGQAGGDPEGRP